MNNNEKTSQNTKTAWRLGKKKKNEKQWKTRANNENIETLIFENNGKHWKNEWKVMKKMEWIAEKTLKHNENVECNNEKQGKSLKTTLKNHGKTLGKETQSKTMKNNSETSVEKQWNRVGSTAKNQWKTRKIMGQ